MLCNQLSTLKPQSETQSVNTLLPVMLWKLS